jgi:putative nucleotidyltransferase with HDIG domain
VGLLRHELSEVRVGRAAQLSEIGGEVTKPLIQGRAIRGARIFLVHLGQGRLRNLSLHFAPRTAFILLERTENSDGRTLGAAFEAMRLGGFPTHANLLATALNSYMSSHGIGVQRVALEIARVLGLDELQVRELAYAAVLHDVGKILVPSRIISKHGPLTQRERMVVQRHAQRGAEILRTLGFPERIARAVDSHHERVDGQGYPSGLRLDEIPMASRIIAVADAFDVMTRPRIYGRCRDSGEAFAELVRCAGRQFDGACVEALLRSAQPIDGFRRLASAALALEGATSLSDGETSSIVVAGAAISSPQTAVASL